MTSTNQPPPVPLAILFSGPVMVPGFTDDTTFTWDPTTHASNTRWQGAFAAGMLPLPATYLALQVVPDASQYKWIWFPSFPSLTINVPPGALSLGTLLQAIYMSTLQQIGTDVYNQLTGLTYDPSAHSGNPPTLATALNDNAKQFGYTNSLDGVAQLDGATMFLKAQ